MSNKHNQVPNSAVKRIIDNPRLLRQTEGQMHRIACPFCKVGYIFIRVEKHGWGKQQEVKVPKIHERHKCEVCGKWSKIKMQLKLTAVIPPEERSDE
jgi:hypothetical protein